MVGTNSQDGLFHAACSSQGRANAITKRARFIVPVQWKKFKGTNVKIREYQARIGLLAVKKPVSRVETRPLQKRGIRESSGFEFGGEEMDHTESEEVGRAGDEEGDLITTSALKNGPDNTGDEKSTQGTSGTADADHGSGGACRKHIGSDGV